MTPSDKSVVFAHRPPSATELARLRLLLSTFQDGTGMLASPDGATLPGWRDFERATALAFDGIPSENKDIMDVRLNDPTREGVFFGISCKMRRELNRARRVGRVTIELSNAARAFWDRLEDDGITSENYRDRAHQVGISIINLIGEWHSSASDDGDGTVIEWYGQSGGQLKYYPAVRDALWKSHTFKLEPLPENIPHGLVSKAETYYRHLWPG